MKFKKGHKINLGKKNVLGKHWKLSDEVRKKAAKSRIGHFVSEKAKIKMSIAKLGEKHPAWKGGISREHHNKDRKYKKWRIAVFIRDSFTCQNCKRVGGYLEAHHIKSWSKYPKLRFVINNGITLCKECHKLIKNG